MRTVLIAIALAASGCGLAVTPEDAGMDAQASELDAGPPPGRDTGPMAIRDAGRDAPPPGCAVTCATHDDCTSMCGPVAGGGIRCCDESTARCYVSHTAVCPGESRDGGYDTLPEPLDGCPMPPLGTTTLTVHAPGFANATVTYVSYYSGGGATFVLDDAGDATVSVAMIGLSRNGVYPALADAWGVPIAFHVTRGAASVDIVPYAFAPSLQDLQPVDFAEVHFARDVAGACAGIVPSVSYGCTAYHGDFAPMQFDDAPCGPF